LNSEHTDDNDYATYAKPNMDKKI